jgi:hypothetical protein
MLWRITVGALARTLAAVQADASAHGLAGRLATSAVPTRSFFEKSAKIFSGLKLTKGERQLFDVKWMDEYASLGDDPTETHKAMVEEDQRLRASSTFKHPLRRVVFDELLQHRKEFRKVRRALSQAVRALCAVVHV